MARRPGDVPVRRAALPLQLQLPRRRLPPRGAGRGGGPARSRGARPHRPRRLLRRGALRRGGPGGGAAHRVRGRAHPRRHPPPERRGRPGGPPPGGAGRAAGGLRPPGPRHQPGPDGGGEGRAPLPPRRAGRRCRRPRGWCSPAAARARCRPRWWHDGPGGGRPRAAAAGRRLRARPGARWSCGTTATRSTPPATTPWPSWPARRGSACVATNNVHYATPAERPLATALAAVRARRSLDELDGWLPAAAGAHLRSGAEQARRFARYPAWWRRRPSWAGAGLRPAAGGAVPAAVPVPRRASTRWATCASSSSEGAAAPLRPPGRQRAQGVGRCIDHELDAHRGARLPRLLPHRVGHRASSASGRNIYCQGRGSAANSAVCYALGITKADAVQPRPAVRAVPVARARRPARHRPRHRERPPGGGHPVRLRALRPPPRRPGGQRHHLPGPVGGPGHGQGPRLRPRPAGRLVQAGRRLGAGRRSPPASPTTTSPPTCWPWPSRSRTSPGTSASTRAAW